MLDALINYALLAYSIGSRLVSFPAQWSGTQSGAKNLINFMNNSCDRPPLH